MSTTSPQTDAPETSERCGHCARLIRVGAFESHWHGRCLSPAQLDPKVVKAAADLGIPLEEAAKIVAVASIPVRTV